MKESLPVSIRVKDKVYDLDYERELKCSEETINDDLKSQAPLFAWHAVMQELAEADLADAKLLLEMTEAALDEKYRVALAKEGKVTETLIGHKVKLDEEYQTAISVFNECRKNVGVLKAIKDAFGHRKDCLISLASNMRAQQDPDIYIKKLEFKNPK